MENLLCPKCGSINIYKSRKLKSWLCEDCGEKFSDETDMKKKWNSGLLADEYWDHSLISVAPVSLSISYQQLYNYVEEGNIGCTLFLIRDVFELMIKIPTVILFDSIYSLYEKSDEFTTLFEEQPKLEALYRNSMQMLSTGKWWECVRLASGLLINSEDLAAMEEYEVSVLLDTLSYMKCISKLFEFRVPGKKKVNMVTWRNRAVGHSCLASKPEESYPEVPYILKMFKRIAEKSLSYYERICFANEDKVLLIGTSLRTHAESVYISYKTDEYRHFYKIHDFVAGRKESMSYYDGYEKGKAFLLDYGDGDRYKDPALSRFIMSAKGDLDKRTISDSVSSANLNEDNLETADIQQLEAQLSVEHQIVHVDYLYQWLMRQVNTNTSGVFVLQAERGMGKSTFCRTIDQLSRSENVRWYSDELDGWSEFMEEAAIRVWHFNSTYYGRKEIYLKGIADTLLTLEAGCVQDGVWTEANRLVGNLDSIWGNLNECAENLRKLYFAEAINLTATEYFKRTNKNKLVLVLDGLDEIPDSRTILSFIPSPEMLHSNVYVLVTCRTDDEISPQLANGVTEGAYASKLVFKRNEIAEYDSSVQVTDQNETYLRAVELYVESAIANLDVQLSFDASEIIEHFESRFSDLTAYFSLCQMSKQFCKLSNTELLPAFLEAVRSNSTNAYYTRMMCILNTMAWCGDSLTLRELAFLSGEGYVSYRFLGILNDLRAFVKVTRTSRGNCYEFSHNEWEESVKEQFPLGGIEFRMRCDRLLENLEELRQENRTADILLDPYEGERWLFTHILSIFNRDWEELKKNWFENIRIGTVEEFMESLIRCKNVNKYQLVNQINFLEFITEYKLACEIFGIDNSKKVTRGSKVEVLFETNRIMKLVVALFENTYDEMSSCREQFDKKEFIRILDVSAEIARKVAFSTDSTEDQKMFHRKSVLMYRQILDYIKEEGFTEQRLLYIYKCARGYSAIGDKNEARNDFAIFIEASTFVRTPTLEFRDYLSRAYIRSALIIIREFEGEEIPECVMKDLSRASAHIRLLLEDSNNNTEFLGTKAWCEEAFAFAYEKKRKFYVAIEFLQKSLYLYEELFRITHKKEWKNSALSIQRKLLRMYKITEQDEKAKESAMLIREQKILLDEKVSVELLQDLVDVCRKTGDIEREKVFAQELKTLEIDEKRRKRNYSELYAFIQALKNQADTRAYDKIPKEFINHVKDNMDEESRVVFDYHRKIDEQFSKDTISLIAVMTINYWGDLTNLNRAMDAYENNEVSYRMKKWKPIIDICSNYNEIGIHGESVNIAFNEAYWVLEHYMPVYLREELSIERLIRIRDSRCHDYIPNLENKDVSEYSPDLIRIIKWAISKD